MLHTKFQASEPSGFEKDFFLNILLCISTVQTKDPWPGTLGPLFHDTW